MVTVLIIILIFHYHIEANQFSQNSPIKIEKNFDHNTYSYICKLIFLIPKNYQILVENYITKNLIITYPTGTFEGVLQIYTSGRDYKIIQDLSKNAISCDKSLGLASNLEVVNIKLACNELGIQLFANNTLNSIQPHLNPKIKDKISILPRASITFFKIKQKIFVLCIKIKDSKRSILCSNLASYVSPEIQTFFINIFIMRLAISLLQIFLGFFIEIPCS